VKIGPHRSTVTLTLAVLTLGLAGGWAISASAASMGLIGIKVDETNDRDRGSSKTSCPYGTELSKTTTTTEKRGMTIILTNRSPKPSENVTVKYWMFARDLATRDGKVISSGQQKVSLKGLESVEIDAKGASIRNSKKRDNSSGYSGCGTGSNTRGTRKLGSQRSGLDYAGYGVVVIDSEGKLIAEDFTAGSMRDLVAKELPVDNNPWGLRKW
jgi:hypothetical protein